jgi:hypothetical protein
MFGYRDGPGWVGLGGSPYSCCSGRVPLSIPTGRPRLFLPDEVSEPPALAGPSRVCGVMAAWAACAAIDRGPGAMAPLLPLLTSGGARLGGCNGCPCRSSCWLLAAFSALVGLPRFFFGGSTC